MDDTPFINDGADTSLRKVVSLLNKIEAKTGSTEITGPVTVSNEVEVTNDEGNPLPVSGTVTANVFGLNPQGLIKALPIAEAGDDQAEIGIPVVANIGGGPQVIGDNYPLPISGTVTATQSTASDLKAQSQLLDSTGTLVDYATIGTAGTPSADVVSVQGVSGGVGIPTIPDAPAISNGIQYQLDNNGPITRPGDVGDGIQYYLDNYGNNIPIYDAASDGVNQKIGALTDTSATNDTGSFSIFAFIKRGMENWTSLLAKIPALVSGRIPVDGSGVTQPVNGTVGISGTVPVSGTFWQATQPVSGTVGISGTVPVSGTFWQTTQPVSIASAISQKVQGWDIPIHDYRGLGYTSGNLTSVTYKTGGASGTTIATLTLGYDGSGNLTSVTKT